MSRRQKNESIVRIPDTELGVHTFTGNEPCRDVTELFKAGLRLNVVAHVMTLCSKVTVFALREKGALVCAVVATLHDGVNIIRFAATKREDRGRGMMQALVKFLRENHTHRLLGVCSHKQAVGFWLKCGFKRGESHLAFKGSDFLCAK
jgi:hypothetical protein